jgi:hypothetical protein
VKPGWHWQAVEQFGMEFVGLTDKRETTIFTRNVVLKREDIFVMLEYRTDIKFSIQNN